jgi:flagellar biosynthesis protein FlhF
MKIKRFRAGNFSDALKEIKKTFGEEAVILSSEQISSGLVEVVAAVDYEREGRKSSQSIRKHKDDEIKYLRREIEQLRDVLILMRRSGYQMRMPDRKYSLLKILMGVSIKEEFALRLCERADDIHSLIDVLSNEIRTVDIKRSKKMVMLFGPTGSGKTSTIIKLASQAIKRGEKIAIISLDNYKIGATEQLKAYTRILRIPFVKTFDIEEIKKTMERFSDVDRIFIDTAGRHPSDEGYLNQLKILCGSDLPLETHLIMSASSDNDFLTESYRYYKQINIDCLGFTKLDEAVNKGCIYNLSLIYQKPIAYVTTGQRIPQDIVFPESKSLARIILGYTDRKSSMKSYEGVDQ